MSGGRKLGRGLEALISPVNTGTMAGLVGGESRDTGADNLLSAETGDRELRHIPVEMIQRGQYQPRTVMQPEALEELAASIRSQGVMQPIVVRSISPGRFEIIAGERRWQAAQMAGLHDIPALVRKVDDEAAVAMALVENIQREDLGPLEEAVALKRLQDEFSLTQQQVADAVGRKRATVANLMRLVTLHWNVRSMLEQGELEMGHARALLSLEHSQQPETANRVVQQGMTVRQTESLVKRILSGDDGKSRKKKKELDADIQSLENSLAEKLGTKVMIRHTAKGRGRLVVNYNSVDELDGILAHIK